MEEIIRNAMNDDIIKQACTRFDTQFSNIKYVGGFENFVYEFEKNDQSFILRFVHSSHRTSDLVEAEIEWIEYLSMHGAKVSKVVHSVNNSIIEIIEANEGYFTVSLFTKAPGTYVQNEDITTQFMEYFGRCVGELHHLTKSYKPLHKRHHFDEENFEAISLRTLKEEDLALHYKFIEIMNEIKSFERDEDSYGLIHTDLHFGNMYYDQSHLTFFDFDDACYKHFISDIAIVLFYMYSHRVDEKGIAEEANQKLKAFLKGYNKENKLDKIWFLRLNTFFRLREVILYIILLAAGEELQQQKHIQAYYQIHKNRILNDTPFMNIEELLKDII